MAENKWVSLGLELTPLNGVIITPLIITGRGRSCIKNQIYDGSPSTSPSYPTNGRKFKCFPGAISYNFHKYPINGVIITKNFRYLMEVLNLLRLFWGWVFPYISHIHTAYIGVSYLHFRYLKCLVTLHR